MRVAGSALDGTQWQLTGWSLSSLAPGDFAISAKFADGKISGRSAVNSYAGTCTLGPGNAFSVGPLASTRMAGPEPAMRAESGYLTLLEQAKSYKLADRTLTLYDAERQRVAALRGREPLAAASVSDARVRLRPSSSAAPRSPR